MNRVTKWLQSGGILKLLGAALGYSFFGFVITLLLVVSGKLWVWLFGSFICGGR